MRVHQQHRLSRKANRLSTRLHRSHAGTHAHVCIPAHVRSKLAPHHRRVAPKWNQCPTTPRPRRAQDRSLPGVAPSARGFAHVSRWRTHGRLLRVELVCVPFAARREMTATGWKRMRMRMRMMTPENAGGACTKTQSNERQTEREVTETVSCPHEAVCVLPGADEALPPQMREVRMMRRTTTQHQLLLPLAKRRTPKMMKRKKRQRTVPC
jgi:hypothetical protein